MSDLLEVKGGKIGIVDGSIYALTDEPYYLKDEKEQGKEIKPFEGSARIKNPLDMYETMVHILNEDYSDPEYVKKFLKIDDEKIIEALIRGKNEEFFDLIGNVEEGKRIKRLYNRLKRYYINDGSVSVDMFIPNGALTSKNVVFIFADKEKNERGLIRVSNVVFRVLIKQLSASLEGTLLLTNNQTNAWATIIRKENQIKVIDYAGRTKVLSDVEREVFSSALEGVFEKRVPHTFRENGNGIVRRKDEYFIVLNGKDYPILNYSYKLLGLFKA